MNAFQSDTRHGRVSTVWLGAVAGFLFTTTAAIAGGAAFGGSATGSATGAVGGTGAVAASSGGGRGSASIGGRSSGGSIGNSAASAGGMRALSGVGGFRGGNFAGGQSGNTFGQTIGVRSGSTFGQTIGARNGVIGGNPLAQSPGTNRSLPAATQQIARVNNLWTDQRSPGFRPGGISQGNASFSQNGNVAKDIRNRGALSGNYPYVRGNVSSSTRLYPGSYGYALRSYNDTRNPAGRPDNDSRHGDHFRNHDGHHSHYYPYYLNSYGYYPYYGGYGYYNGGFGINSYYGDASGLDTDSSLTPDLSTYDGGSQPVPQMDVDGPGNTLPPDSEQIPPAARSQTPWADQQEPAKPAPSLGPDSMVEAVQEKLAERGYFKGKVDAMFRPDTKEAIRQFQADNHLAETGLLNKATLVMLGLN